MAALETALGNLITYGAIADIDITTEFDSIIHGDASSYPNDSTFTNITVDGDDTSTSTLKADIDEVWNGFGGFRPVATLIDFSNPPSSIPTGPHYTTSSALVNTTLTLDATFVEGYPMVWAFFIDTSLTIQSGFDIVDINFPPGENSLGKIYWFVGDSIAPDAEAITVGPGTITRGHLITYQSIVFESNTGVPNSGSVHNGGAFSRNGSVTLSDTEIYPFNPVCFIGSTQVLMFDNTYKSIKDIKRGDIIIEDIKTRKMNVVARMSKTNVFLNTIVNKIPKGLIGNTDDLICSEHPIWCNKDQNRIFPSKIDGCEKVTLLEPLYNIQYEDEGTFYANGIKVDSLPPYTPSFKLPKKLYFHPEKYDDTKVVVSEDDAFRDKPSMTNTFIEI
jgi:hypothetical protein